MSFSRVNFTLFSYKILNRTCISSIHIDTNSRVWNSVSIVCPLLIGFNIGKLRSLWMVHLYRNMSDSVSNTYTRMYLVECIWFVNERIH